MCLEKGGPSEIQVRSDAMTFMLGDFCREIGIKLWVGRRLLAIEQIMEELA